MTIRDLTPRQVTKLQKQCAKVYKIKQIDRIQATTKTVFEAGFSEGLKAGLEFCKPAK